MAGFGGRDLELGHALFFEHLLGGVEVVSTLLEGIIVAGIPWPSTSLPTTPAERKMVSFMVWRSTISLRASRTSGSSKGAADALRQKRKELEFSMPPVKTLKPDWPSSVAAFVVEIWWAKSTSPLVSARVPRLGIGDGDDLNRVDGRSASPVIGVLLKHGSSVGREGNELEGPAADVAREIVAGAARREHEGDGGNDLVPEGGLAAREAGA